MKYFDFKEIDTEGHETLEILSEANRFNEWMFETIKPFCKGKILEVGSGIGNISKFFVQNSADITLSDIRQNYCENLKASFPNQKVLHLDLVAQDFDSRFESYLEYFDTIFALNVIEHIEDDFKAVENAKKLLKSQGCLIILVPAYQVLYNNFDIALHHYRRYTKKTLTELFYSQKFQIVHKQYFNCMGILGWYISGKIQKNKTLPKNQVRLYNFLVPIFKLIDKIVFNQIGLSVIVVGKKR